MFSLRKILLPIDFSDRCRVVVHHTVPSLATCFSSEVILLHVLPRYGEFGAAELGISLGEGWIAQRRMQARHDLHSFVSKELSQLSLKKVVIEGDPGRSIVEYAHSEHADLIVMPTHGYGPVRKLLLGSVTAKVLHDASAPVWTGVHLDEEPVGDVMALKHILCALDLKAHSETTLRWAKDLATAFHSRLTLLHVVSSFDPRIGAYSFAADWQESMFDIAMAEIEKLQSKMGTRAKVHLEMGDVPRTVCSAAQELKADLLVIGRGAAAHGEGRLPMDAYSIVRQSPCPVVGV